MPGHPVLRTLGCGGMMRTIARAVAIAFFTVAATVCGEAADAAFQQWLAAQWPAAQLWASPGPRSIPLSGDLTRLVAARPRHSGSGREGSTAAGICADPVAIPARVGFDRLATRVGSSPRSIAIRWHASKKNLACLAAWCWRSGRAKPTMVAISYRTMLFACWPHKLTSVSARILPQ